MDVRPDLRLGDGIYPGKVGGVRISYNRRNEVMIMATIPFDQLLETAQGLEPTQKRILLDRLQADLDREPWALADEQLGFMIRHHELIENAYARDDMEALRELARSAEYRAAFGEMSWDEAYDRYEETWLTQLRSTQG